MPRFSIAFDTPESPARPKELSWYRMAIRDMPRSVVRCSIQVSVSWSYEPRTLITLPSAGLRRKAAPVNGPINGTPAWVAIGWAALEVGVPTSPTSANTPSLSIRRCGIGNRLFRLVAVVVEDQLEPATVNSAGGICFVEGGENPLAHAETQRRCGPVEGRGLSEYDPVVEHTRLGVGRDVHKRGRPKPHHRSDCNPSKPPRHKSHPREGATLTETALGN